MNDATRRTFMATAGVGAAAAGIAALAPGAQAATRTTEDTSSPRDAAGTLVAHVTDLHGDAVTLFVGDREVVVHDRALVARLARAAF